MSESSRSTGSPSRRKSAKKATAAAKSHARAQSKASSSAPRSRARATTGQEPSGTERAQALGLRVTRYREDRGMNLTELARQSELSKSYLSAIEAGEVPRPSGESLYALARPLGVTMSDLLGRKLLTAKQPKPSASLREFAAEHGLLTADIRMLAAIQFRGDPPKTKERWAMIYSAIRQSEWMDQDRP